MSNEIDPQAPSGTDALRTDDLAAAAAAKKSPLTSHFATPPIDLPSEHKPATASEVVAAVKELEAKLRAEISAAAFDPTQAGQALRKDQVPLITDYSKIKMEDVYDLNVPITAKPLMTADMLEVKLLDTNYEPRWVNTHPQRLGEMIAKGFIYINSADLLPEIREPFKLFEDATGHFVVNDVVAMRIDKATYFSALRAAFERAIATTDQTRALERAKAEASNYMQQSEFSSDYVGAARARKMDFYNPNISI